MNPSTGNTSVTATGNTTAGISTAVVVAPIETPPQMTVSEYIETSFFDSRRLAGMSQLSGQALRDAMGRNRNGAAGAWEQLWKHNGGKGMRTTFTVSDDGDSKWVRVQEEEVYQERLNELFDRLSLRYGESEPMPPTLSWDYLVIGMPLDLLYLIVDNEHRKK